MTIEEIREEHGNEVSKIVVQYTFVVNKWIDIDIVDFENSNDDDIEKYIAEQPRSFDIDDDINTIDDFEIIDAE